MKTLSFSLSIVINFLLLTTLFLTLSFSVKRKEEIKITLLESTPLPIISPSTFPSKAESPTNKGEDKREIPKAKEKFIPKERSREEKALAKEESLLEERLKGLERKSNHRDSLSDEGDIKILQERLAGLQAKRFAKAKAEEAVSEASKQGVSSGRASNVEGKLSEEYLLLVKRKLQTHFEVPIYLKNRSGLSALVELEVGKSGEIKRITFLKRAEEGAFNQAVERCLRAVNPLPVDREVTMRIEFRAEGVLRVNY